MTIYKIPFSNSQGSQPSLAKHFLIILAKVICMAVVLSNLSACGKRKVVVTSDDSVEYKSARSLPPLIKPTQDTTASVESTVSQVEPVSSLEPVPTLLLSVLDLHLPIVDLHLPMVILVS